MFCRAAGTLIFHGKIYKFYFISIIRVQQFYIIVDILYMTFIDIFHKSIKVPSAFTLQLHFWYLHLVMVECPGNRSLMRVGSSVKSDNFTA